LTRIIRKGRTPIFWAVEANKPDSIEMLCMMNADVNLCDLCACRLLPAVDQFTFVCRDGASPLVVALLLNRTQCIAVLEAADAK
jgi:hypothetical protein